MEKLDFIVQLEDAGKRIDKYITLKLGENYSRMFVKGLIETQAVRVENKEVKPHYIVRTGDKIFVELASCSAAETLEPQNIPLNIIYEDDSIIVIDKPAGIVVHPGAGNKRGTIVNALLYHCMELADTGDNLKPGIVHRLDKDTSGVMVAVKTDRAMRSISKQFQKRAVKKHYIALVKGRVELDNDIIEAPLARGILDRRKMEVGYEGAKDARTIYHVIERFEKFTLVRLELLTGRTHQIRAHMKYIGYPVLGDAEYGDGRGMSRQALHAELLGFIHPVTGKYVEFTSPMPEDMKQVIEKESKLTR